MTKTGLRSWILLSSLLPALLISVLLGSYFSYVRYQELQLYLTEQADNLAIPLSVTAAELLEAENFTGLKHLLDSSHRLNAPVVTSIALYNSQNQLITSSNPHQQLNHLRLETPATLAVSGLLQQTEEHILRYQPLLSASADHALPGSVPSAGYLLVQLQKDRILLKQQRNLLYTLLIIFAGLLLSTLCGLYLYHKLRYPVQQLMQQLSKLQQGKYTRQQQEIPITELAVFQQKLNLLAGNLAQAEQETQQHIEQATSDLQQSMEQLEVQNIQLDFARRKALEENRQKSEFLAKMSHELRTPLNGVIGFTRQLLKTQLTASQQDYLTTIQKSANSLLHLVNDVLDFSRLEEGRMSINPEPFSLRDLLSDATELLAANAFDKHLELVLMVDPECPDDLIADPVRFTQVLMNIAGNAIKFTDHGSIVIRISASALNDDQLILHCSVQDTGKGISQEQQNTLFQGFSAATQQQHQMGSGLGLIISQRLVQAMGGNIGFESKTAEGSTFWFTIKCQLSQLSVAESLPVAVLEGKSLLYFEPQQYSRDATHSLLQSWGLQVTVCAIKEQLQQALAGSQHYDIALIGRAVALNQVNQVMNLISLVKPACQYTYLLINTLSPNLREAMLASGADACLSKPAHQRKLAMTLAQPYLAKVQLHSWQPEQKPASLRILTVDDNAANLKLINTLLEEYAENIDSAHDGAEAWHKTTQHVYDIIFMDINMPVMDGVSACQRIRKSSLNERTPIVAVTAHAVQGERTRLLAQGFNEFLSKPLDENKLYCVLQEYCPGFKPAGTTATITDKTWPDSPLIDRDLALQRAGGKQTLAIDMLQMLFNSIPDARKQLQRAIADSNADQVQQQVHKLHGACCYTGVPRLKKLVEELETQLKHGAGLKSVEPELFELEDLLNTLYEYSLKWAS
ncbi:two-component sensor histidine kinase BarA [Chromatiaceae bacterium AAb-1]|nr:two-component sensor histidine kinase BarA [Chromatiaceae bacterium AAb-1]